jgi:hypothetical protein
MLGKGPGVVVDCVLEDGRKHEQVELCLDDAKKTMLSHVIVPTAVSTLIFTSQRRHSPLLLYG